MGILLIWNPEKSGSIFAKTLPLDAPVIKTDLIQKDTIPPGAPATEPPAAIEEHPSFGRIFHKNDKKPQFEGGESALVKYLAESIRYPEIARRDSIEGKVIVQFVIDENGQVGEANILHGIGGGCDEEALRIVKSTSGKWKPGEQGGNPVKTWYTVPLSFKLKPKTGALAPSPDDKIYRVVEEKPEFEGGEAGLLRYIAENIKSPAVNRDSVELGSRIIVQFVVDEHGNAVDATLVRSISKEVDQQILQLVKNTSGKWKPGKMHGRPVKVYFTLPINIHLQ